MSTTTMSRLEQEVLKQLLTGDHPVLESLRAQMGHLSVKSREFTGSGFYTELQFDGAAEPASMSEETAWIRGVDATISGLERGAGFMVHVKDGYLDLIEGFTYQEPWPSSIGDFSVHAASDRRLDEMLK
jgi:hypothetical protein